MVLPSNTNSFSKEMTIRRRICNIYNKREEDFSCLKEYNDYLEEVEEMTLDLIEGRDVAAIESKISLYEEQNSEQIMVSHARKAEDYAAALAAYKGRPIQPDNGAVRAEVGAQVQGRYAPAQHRMAQPVPLVSTGGGPDPHGSLCDNQQLMRARGRAGGWSDEFSKKRAIAEAFGSLFC